MEGSPYRQFAISWSWRRFLELIPGYPILGILSVPKTGTRRSGSCLGPGGKLYLSIPQAGHRSSNPAIPGSTQAGTVF
ncbi:hypothetical protein F2Q69_00042804 [Brassica cretica]|uniref:Uncharacterized protein n=1 Tax=Brassica cretica TaxID=69181 RepID=A0A8S9NJG2_BRACR|nr:hypothetical protein F2Q69_00042804 [Brassica cretica]